MPDRQLAFITVVCLSILPSASGRSQQLASDGTEPPLHEQLLELLRTDEGVLPKSLLDAHPVRTVFNREAIIPPQCYTLTEGQFNPCYVCHQNEMPGRENTMNDGLRIARRTASSIIKPRTIPWSA